MLITVLFLFGFSLTNNVIVSDINAMILNIEIGIFIGKYKYILRKKKDDSLKLSILGIFHSNKDVKYYEKA